MVAPPAARDAPLATEDAALATAPPASLAPAMPPTAAPPASTAVPAAAPAPSCGPPATMPLAIPGPNMPSPSRVRLASTIASASSMVGSPGMALVNSAKSVEPIPIMTASTSTLMPEETTFPSTRSAMKAVLPNRPKGMSTKPASVVSLNSMSVTKSWIDRMKKATTTKAQATSRMMICRKFSKKLT